MPILHTYESVFCVSTDVEWKHENALMIEAETSDDHLSDSGPVMYLTISGYVGYNGSPTPITSASRRVPSYIEH